MCFVREKWQEEEIQLLFNLLPKTSDLFCIASELICTSVAKAAVGLLYRSIANAGALLRAWLEYFMKPLMYKSKMQPQCVRVLGPLILLWDTLSCSSASGAADA